MKWISVKERLPELDYIDTSFRSSKYVVVLMKSTPRIEIAKLEGSTDLYWFLSSYDDAEELGHVTHWMPLPELPKED